MLRSERKLKHVMQAIEDAASLLRVLLISELISIGYAIPVRQMLEDIENVRRRLVNCGPTKRGIASIGRSPATQMNCIIQMRVTRLLFGRRRPACRLMLLQSDYKHTRGDRP